MELPTGLGLTEPEKLMWNAVAAGCGISLGDGDPREAALPNDQELEKRTIRGPVLAMLLSQVGAGMPLATSEVHIRGARVVGAVDLSHSELPALQFGQCVFENSLVLLSARIRKLHLENCVLDSIEATGASIEGLLLITQSKVMQGISLIEARVGQSVGLSGSEVIGCDRPALHADGLITGGGLILGTFPSEDGCVDNFEIFVAKGQVRLLGARIGRDLDCSGGRFENAGDIALAADRAEIHSEVRLASGFYAQGEVRLWRIRIGSDLNCLDGRFDNFKRSQTKTSIEDPRALVSRAVLGQPGDCALTAEGAEIEGSVNLCNKFRANGVVYLVGAQIDSDLNCSGGMFHNPSGDALAADSTKIGGSVRLNDGFHASGLVGLLGTRVAGQLNCSGGRFNSPRGKALGGDGAEIRGNVNLAEGFHATGELRLLSARLDGQLNCTRGTFENRNKTALTLQEARVNSLWLRDLGSGTVGQIVLSGARVYLLADDPELSARLGVDLYLNGFVYDQVAPDSPQDVGTRLNWPNRKSDEYHSHPFNQLLAYYRRNGQEQEARDVWVAKRRARREAAPRWLSKTWDIFLDWSMLYGLQPWRPLLLGFVFFLLAFGLILGAQLTDRIVGPADQISAYHPLIHALDVFLPGVELGVEALWKIDTSSGDTFAWIVTVLLWILKLVGWFVVTLVPVALTGIVRRE